MPVWIQLLMPVVTIVGVVVPEVWCLERGIPHRHRAAVCSVALVVWSVYYVAVAILDIARGWFELSVVAGGLSMLIGSLTRRALQMRPESESVAGSVPVEARAGATSRT